MTQPHSGFAVFMIPSLAEWMIALIVFLSIFCGIFAVRRRRLSHGLLSFLGFILFLSPNPSC